MSIDPAAIVDYVISWCYKNLNELVLVWDENLFNYPAVTELQEDFNTRFLDKKSFDALIKGNKKDVEDKIREINDFVGHCLRIVKQQGTDALTARCFKMNTEGKLIVSVDDLLPEVCQIRVNDFSIPVRRIELLMNELMFLDETMVYKILTPQEAKQLKFEEALDALKVSLRPFQPRKEI